MTNSNPFNQRTAAPMPQATSQPIIEAQPVSVRDEVVRRSVAFAYGHMALGVGLTALVAWISASTGAVLNVLMTLGSTGWTILLIAQMVFAIFLSYKALTLSPTVARIMFYVYAASMGFTLSTIFFVYSVGSIALAFGLTAAFFLALTMIGLTTKVNLLKLGPILVVALIAVIVIELLMMLFGASGGDMLLSGITFLIFAGFTAYDAQRTRALYAQYGTTDTAVKRISIFAALSLYLDFINMLLSLLRLTGGRD